jgi:actin-like ATPase involved in cell morphogenesis
VADWQLGIDLGTSRTRAAVGAGGVATVIELEPEGGDWMPSCVFQAEDGEVIVGRAALRLAALRPERFDPQPRRLVGLAELYIGGEPVSITDLVAAVLRRALEAAVQHQGGSSPRRVLLSFPAQWGDGRQAALLDAAEYAGIRDPELVTEAEAAAGSAMSDTLPGQHLAVCDLGGARCEATVFVRTQSGLAMAGPPAERDPLGGDDIDERILDHLGKLLAADHPDDWNALLGPSSARERSQAQALRDELRRAKEVLSGNEACEVSVPGISPELQLTRQELEDMTSELAQDMAEVLQLALDRAKLSAGDLERLYLVGGTGAVPLVQDAIWRRLEPARPLVPPDPGAAVVNGASLWTGQGRRPRSWAPGRRRPDRRAMAPSTPDGSARLFAPSLVMVLDPPETGGAFECSAIVSFTTGRPDEVVTLEDDPAKVSGSEELAAGLSRELPVPPELVEAGSGPVGIAGNGAGWEVAYVKRDSPGEVALRRRCLVADGRALVLTAPEDLSYVLDSVVRRQPDAPGRFEVGWTVSFDGDWTIDEKLVLRNSSSGHQVAAICRTASAAFSAEYWIEEHLAPFGSLPGVEGNPSRTAGDVCGGLDGQIFTFRWHEAGRAMRTKVGLAVAGRRGFSVAITLPRNEQSLFPSLVRHAQLQPELARRLGLGD